MEFNIYLKYLLYVLRHKWYVFLACCDYGIPIVGLVHDWSKFRPSEFIPYARHFAGNIRKGRDKTGYYDPMKAEDLEFRKAWFLHQRRNKHHWQYWTTPSSTGNEVLREVIPIDIPRTNAIEMVCDWIGAGRAQGTPDTNGWYDANKDKLVLTTDARNLIEAVLLFEEGRDKNGTGKMRCMRSVRR